MERVDLRQLVTTFERTKFSMSEKRSSSERGYLEIQDHGLSAKQTIKFPIKANLKLDSLKQSWKHENCGASDYLLRNYSCSISYLFLCFLKD